MSTIVLANVEAPIQRSRHIVTLAACVKIKDKKSVIEEITNRDIHLKYTLWKNAPFRGMPNAMKTSAATVKKISKVIVDIAIMPMNFPTRN